MVRYIGPRLRITRRLGLLPGLTRKHSRRTPVTTPGEHGKSLFKNPGRKYLREDYKDRLIEKQKLRNNYGITEHQLISYYKKAKKSRVSTGKVLLQLLESRLDCIIFRLGFAETIPAARQLINHRHILVNKKLIDIPSFICCKGDIISVKDNKKSQKLIGTQFFLRQETRRLIFERMAEIGITIPRPNPLLLPRHLEIIDDLNLVGKMVTLVKRKSLLVKVKELKVIEYYSR
jgi:small subunit ribosomal protein S4